MSREVPGSPSSDGMKASGVILNVISFLLLLLLLLLLAGRGDTALVPPDSALEPPAPMGDGQILSPLKASPRNLLGDGQPPQIRRRRHSSHFPLCSYCCNCCRNRGCGLCCRT
ncbi:hepcidin [Grus americana]|uniref:hepcidin n=1 Tax=Grus americana TaxID=9117 RepID=UPI0024081753|nr:hepcidin [Grus americana]